MRTKINLTTYIRLSLIGFYYVLQLLHTVLGHLLFVLQLLHFLC